MGVTGRWDNWVVTKSRMRQLVPFRRSQTGDSSASNTVGSKVEWMVELFAILPILNFRCVDKVWFQRRREREVRALLTYAGQAGKAVLRIEGSLQHSNILTAGISQRQTASISKNFQGKAVKPSDLCCLSPFKSVWMRWRIKVHLLPFSCTIMTCGNFVTVNSHACSIFNHTHAYPSALCRPP